MQPSIERETPAHRQASRAHPGFRSAQFSRHRWPPLWQPSIVTSTTLAMPNWDRTRSWQQGGRRQMPTVFERGLRGMAASQTLLARSRISRRWRATNLIVRPASYESCESLRIWALKPLMWLRSAPWRTFPAGLCSSRCPPRRGCPSQFHCPDHLRCQWPANDAI